MNYKELQSIEKYFVDNVSVYIDDTNIDAACGRVIFENEKSLLEYFNNMYGSKFNGTKFNTINEAKFWVEKFKNEIEDSDGFNPDYYQDELSICEFWDNLKESYMYVYSNNGITCGLVDDSWYSLDEFENWRTLDDELDGIGIDCVDEFLDYVDGAQD